MTILRKGQNAFTVMLAHELKETAIKVNSADPGFTATDLKLIAATKPSSKARRSSPNW